MDIRVTFVQPGETDPITRVFPNCRAFARPGAIYIVDIYSNAQKKVILSLPRTNVHEISLVRKEQTNEDKS